MFVWSAFSAVVSRCVICCAFCVLTPVICALFNYWLLFLRVVLTHKSDILQETKVPKDLFFFYANATISLTLSLLAFGSSAFWISCFLHNILLLFRVTRCFTSRVCLYLQINETSSVANSSLLASEFAIETWTPLKVFMLSLSYSLIVDALTFASAGNNWGVMANTAIQLLVEKFARALRTAM